MSYITLFFNDKKTEGDNLPLYANGKIKFDEPIDPNLTYEVALWKKTQDKNGNPMNALTIKIAPSDYWNNKEQSEAPKETPNLDDPISF